MTDPHFNLADLLKSEANDPTKALDDEVVQAPNESGPIYYPGEQVPNESGPIYYDPANDPANNPTDSDPYVHGVDGPPPFVYDPANDPADDPAGADPILADPVESPHGADTPIEPGDIDWGASADEPNEPNETEQPDQPVRIDPVDLHEDDGEVSIQPVDAAPVEHVFIEADPEQEPGPEMSIQPVESEPVVEADEVP